MNSKDAIERATGAMRASLRSCGYGGPGKCHSCDLDKAAVQAIDADAQALADVRTLDEANPCWSMQPARDCDDGSMIACEVRLRVFEAETPEAARAKAAAWVLEQKLSS